MRKNIAVSIYTLLLALACSGNVAAATYTDVYDAGGILLGNTGGCGGCGGGSGTSSDSWTFDITDDGYAPTLETVISATVSVDITHNGHGHHGRFAWAELVADGSVAATWQVATETEVISLTSLATLDSTGMLDMTLTATTGSFNFNTATLVAETVSAVPVPAAVWLFGSGLLGLVGIARAKKQA